MQKANPHRLAFLFSFGTKVIVIDFAANELAAYE
jgi:hypothetical protein